MTLVVWGATTGEGGGAGATVDPVCAECGRVKSNHVARRVVLRPGGPSEVRLLCRSQPTVYRETEAGSTAEFLALLAHSVDAADAAEVALKAGKPLECAEMVEFRRAMREVNERSLPFLLGSRS